MTMEKRMNRLVLKGSERAPLGDARSTGKADPSERLEVTVLLRRRGIDDLKAQLGRLHAGDRTAAHLTRAEFARRHGATPDDLAAVRRFARDHGLAVVHEDPAARSVILAGTVARFDEAFGVALEYYEHPQGTYRGRTGPIMLPQDLAPAVEAVLGLDDRPVAHPHLRRVGEAAGSAVPPGAFDPTQLASLYQFPTGSGAGQTIGIIELGGGFRTKDLTRYFAEVGVAAPRVTAVSVDHAKNRPTGQTSGPDGEVVLDIEVVGAIAPRAKIVVYFAPNTDAGFLDAISAAIHDTTNAPSVISISWGAAESTWTDQSLAAYDQAFQAAVAMGISVCVASGDSGSSDGVNDGRDHVDFPASSPHLLACGGTTTVAANGTITRESVWNDGAQGGATGGGLSSFFAAPAWQAGLTASRADGTSTQLDQRGVPDVAGNADPQTGYHVRVDGSETVFGGTSAVAPLWAALIARINSGRGSNVGFVNPTLYRAASALRDITSGNNGAFLAATGWDACTGLGSPNGKTIAGLF
jgi:kumamolisin